MKRYNSYFENSVYAFKGEFSILEEKDLGICADVSSLRTPEYSVAAADCFQGCPYTDTGFHLDVVTNGERVKVKEWVWLPNAMKRVGETADFTIETITAVVPKSRRFVMGVTYKNKTSKVLTLPFQIEYTANPRYESNWDFLGPQTAKNLVTNTIPQKNGVYLETDDCGMNITVSIPVKLFKLARLLEGEITLNPNGEYTVFITVQFDKKEAVLKGENLENFDFYDFMQSSFEWFSKESKRIYDNLPHLSSDNKALDNLYYRSLVTYMLCRWENSDLCAVPYFSTGSINGACMCSYLWDYCGGLMIHPIYDTFGNKKQLLAYLKNDLTTSYALNPVTAGKVGPWYQVNQEKIICMVYYHVLFTGEKEFLFQVVEGKTVLEWMKHYAYACDEGKDGNSLFNYGKSGFDHLELRRGILYDGIMPDLNARRYMNYMRVWELCNVAKMPCDDLKERALGLKEKLKTLWNDDIKWYDFIDSNGKRDVRYTVQMFKFLNSPVIDAKEREGLISHLNETEFLSKFGLHSMSKLDIAYDQEDIDNGGGGICTHFTMQICGQLYEIGYDKLATDILSRVYWWGERMPYMGDSCAANMIRNREDTPLQGDISSVSAAQMIFFFIFGIRADFDGNITVCPVENRPAANMKIENARLCGKVFSVEITGKEFTVTSKDIVYKAQIGQKIKF
ncbi:MAG: hypothetical protein E7537_00120 [Ruminococcaceae bacterium]|nr:hypothetical protein [Oscillospiraceae bacterium]